jgi:hypothetical protein
MVSRKHHGATERLQKYHILEEVLFVDLRKLREGDLSVDLTLA